MEKYSICVLGDRGCGKTKVCKTVTQDTLCVKTAINIFVSSYKFSAIEWWDFSGNPKYTALRKVFFKFFNGYVLVFDLSNRKSFKHLSRWEKEISSWVKATNSPVIIVGTKKDLGVSMVYNRDFTVVSKGILVQSDWDAFFAKVAATDNEKIRVLNTPPEEENENSEKKHLKSKD